MRHLSTTYGPKSTDFMIFAIHMLGVSSILAALNIIVTIFNMACTWYELDEVTDLCMELVGYGLLIVSSYACVSRLCDNDVNG